MEPTSKLEQHLQSASQQAEKLTGQKVVPGIEQERDLDLEKKSQHARTLSDLIDRSRESRGRSR